MRFLRMRPGHGEQLIAEGDASVAADHERLLATFREQLDEGQWAAIPTESPTGLREATLINDFGDVPTGTARVIFFPRAAGGAA